MYGCVKQEKRMNEKKKMKKKKELLLFLLQGPGLPVMTQEFIIIAGISALPPLESACGHLDHPQENHFFFLLLL